MVCFVRTHVYTLLVCFLVCANSNVHAADEFVAEPVYDFVVSATFLEAALIQLAQQANIQLIMNSDSHSLQYRPKVKKIITLNGRYTLSQALNQLLKESELAFDFSPINTIVIRPQSATDKQIKEASVNHEVLLEELVITSQKRRQRLQGVAMTVNTFSGLHIDHANVTRIEEFVQSAAAVTFDTRRDFGTSSFRIRGIGTLVLDSGIEPSVATVIDNVVMSQGGAALNELSDMERIEILNGPQGTLFGKNASAGVVHIITRQPDLENKEFSVEASVSTDEDHRIDFGIAMPVNDQFAFRYSGYWRSYDGNVENVFTGNKLNGVDAIGSRFKLLWAPSEQSELLLSLDYSDQNTECCIRVLRKDVLGVTVDPAMVGDNTAPGSIAQITGLSIGHSNHQVNVDREPVNDATNYGVSVQANIELNNFSLISISSVRHFDTSGSRDNDETPINFSKHQQAIKQSEWLSQELRLTSVAELRYDYLLGLYIYQAENTSRDFVDRILIHNGVDQRINIQASVENRNYAVFGHFNRKIFQKLSLFGGFRQIYDRVEATIERQGRNLDADGLLMVDFTTSPVSQHKADNHLIEKLGLQYEFDPDLMLYTFWSTGFKGRGFTTEFGFDPDRFYTQEPIMPETSESIEVGLKSVLFGNRARINLAGFVTTINDLQLTVRNLSTLDNTLGSVPQVSTRGVNIDFSLIPSMRWSITGGIAWTRAVFENFANGLCYLGQTVVQGCLDGRQNLSGKVLPNAPRWKTMLTARYKTKIFTRFSGFIQADHQYQSDVLFLESTDPDSRQEDYSIVDFSVGVTSADDRYKLTFFVKNIFNQRYVTGVSSNGLGGGGINLHTMGRNFDRYIGTTFRIKY